VPEERRDDTEMIKKKANAHIDEEGKAQPKRNIDAKSKARPLAASREWATGKKQNRRGSPLRKYLKVTGEMKTLMMREEKEGAQCRDKASKRRQNLRRS